MIYTFAILSEDTIVFCNICVKILRESSKSTLQSGAFLCPKGGEELAKAFASNKYDKILFAFLGKLWYTFNISNINYQYYNRYFLKYYFSFRLL